MTDHLHPTFRPSFNEGNFKQPHLQIFVKSNVLSTKQMDSGKIMLNIKAVMS